MRIKKTTINGYPIGIYKTKKYSTIDMRFLFQIPYTKENIYLCDILEEYMLYSSKKYKTRKEINEKRMELYSMAFGLNNYNVGESLFIEATFSFFDPELVSDDYIGDALEFASEMLLNPNFENGLLDRDEFLRSKDNLKTTIYDGVISPKAKASRMLAKIAFPNTYKTRDFIETKSECDELLDGFCDADLIDMHRKVFEESLVGAIVMGNVKDDFLSHIERWFKFEDTKKIDLKFKDKLNISKKTPEYTRCEDEDLKESILKCIYLCPARNRKERAAYVAISRMLESSGIMLHKVLRDELKLVYTASSFYRWKSKSMYFTAYIDAKNEKKTIDGFDKVLDKLKDPELAFDLLNKIKEEFDLTLYTFDENKWNPFFELYDRFFGFDISILRKKKVLDSLTVEDIMEALDKMKRVKTLFVEGVKK